MVAEMKVERTMKILWGAPGKFETEFGQPEKMADGATALFFKIPKSYSSSPVRIKSNMDFIDHLQTVLAEKTGRNIPCFLIPEDVEMVQVEVAPAERISLWEAFTTFLKKKNSPVPLMGKAKRN